MSRSEMAVLLPSRPTALQVMVADIENGIVETKILHVCAACCKWAGLGATRGCRRMALSIYDAAVVFVDCFPMVCVA